MAFIFIQMNHLLTASSSVILHNFSNILSFSSNEGNAFNVTFYITQSLENLKWRKKMLENVEIFVIYFNIRNLNINGLWFNKHHTDIIEGCPDILSLSLNWLLAFDSKIERALPLHVVTFDFLCSFPKDLWYFFFICTCTLRCAHMRMRLIDYINRFRYLERFNTKINSNPDFPLKQNERNCILKWEHL